MTSNEMFEAFMRKEFAAVSLDRKPVPPFDPNKTRSVVVEYVNLAAQSLWVAWQAARTEVIEDIRYHGCMDHGCSASLVEYLEMQNVNRVGPC